MLKVVVLLLCVLGSGVVPAGTASKSSRKYYEVDLPQDDELDEAGVGQQGQSPWLEFEDQQQAMLSQHHFFPPDAEDLLVYREEMSPEQAAAILEWVTAAAAAAAAGGTGTTAASTPPAAADDSMAVLTGITHMGAGPLDTADDAAAAAMQFLAVDSSAQGLLQPEAGAAASGPAPPFLQPLVSSPAPAPLPRAVAPAPGTADLAQQQQQLAAAAAAAGGSPPPAPAPSPESFGGQGTQQPQQQPAQQQPAAGGSPPPAPAPSPASFSTGVQLPAPPAVQSPPPAPAPARLGSEAQLPGLDDLDALLAEAPTPAPPFIPASQAAPAEQQPPAPAPAAPASAQEQQEEGAQAEEKGDSAVKVSVMGRGLWTGHGGSKAVVFPTEPQVPPAWNNMAPAGFCDPDRGLEPTDDGKCVCMKGYGTNADMRTCSRCPVGWYSRGGEVGSVFCKPCPQLSTANPSRTACVAKRNVIRPDVPNSLCQRCVIPERPFDPPTCCPRGQVCCGLEGCCPTRRCFNNATTGFAPKCCGDDCNIGKTLKCCPGGEICVNITAGSQSCCAPDKVCGTGTATRSCCSNDQSCCGDRDCCNTGANASPKQLCTENNVTGPIQNNLRCCLGTQINCNGTCCTTLDSPATQTCLVDATGVAICCNRDRLCESQADSITQCCSSTQVCTRNSSTSSGLTVSRCCPAGFSLCPKNSFQPVCCLAGKCPSPSTSDNCLP